MGLQGHFSHTRPGRPCSSGQNRSLCGRLRFLRGCDLGLEASSFWKSTSEPLIPCVCDGANYCGCGRPQQASAVTLSAFPVPAPRHHVTATFGTGPAAPAASRCADPGIDRVLHRKKSVRFDCIHVKVKRGKVLLRDAHIGSQRIKKSKKMISVKTRVRPAVGWGPLQSGQWFCLDPGELLC